MHTGRWYRGAVALVLLLATGQVFADNGAPGQSITLVYTGNLDGELEPCGCTLEGDFGGILRQATMLDELRAKTPELIAVSSGGLLVSGFASDALKSEFILRGVAGLRYDAVGIQWSDLAFGPELLTQHPVPWVASNWGEATFPPVRMLDAAGRKIAVFSWLDPEASPYRQMKARLEVVSADSEPLRRALAKAKQEHAITLLLTSLSMQEAREHLPLEDVDLLVLRSAYEVYGEPFRDGRTLVLQPGSRGMRFGVLELTVGENGDPISWTHRVIELGVDVPDAARLAEWYDEYNRRVEAAYQDSVQRRKAAETGQSPFVGEAACQSCHEESHARWRGSLHSRAFRKLEDVNKAFDPNCIVCHTVGFNTPGGYLDTDTTEHLLNVQCESCHGAGREHAQSAGALKTPNQAWPPAQICAQCHTKTHSPSFDFEQYWPRIAH